EEEEGAHVDDLRRPLERIGGAALGTAPDERHLAALDPRPPRAALTGGLAFAAAAGRLADPGAGTGAFADPRAMRAARRLQIVQRKTLELGLGAGGSGLGLRPRLPRRFCLRLWHLTSFLPSLASPRR